MPALRTERLDLFPVTLPFVEAVMAQDRARAEAICGARLPLAWPGPDLVARAFGLSLDAIRADPDCRLWGDTLLVTRGGEPRVVGSVIFHGRPPDGIAEVGYGVDEAEQRQGYASEATRACVEWALVQPGIDAVTAVTFPWHVASLRVIERCGMTRTDTREHPYLGEMLVFERRRG
ncbi:MAG: GNAT family N-acetyltransferase [Deltaproteobacteria bacterium]|nr:GNAT family N-acetyltransferase [Kofleriaceae bacterium]